MSSLPTTQTAIASPAKRSPLTSVTVPVHQPSHGEIVVKVQWVASSPLDLHVADGGLLAESYPKLTGGGGAAGQVVAVGPTTTTTTTNDKEKDHNLQVGDKVMLFAFRGDKEANHQQYITIPSFLASKIPDGVSLQAAATIPVNLVTVFHTVTKDLGLDLPWPIPTEAGWKPQEADAPILVWGASSSVGVYAVQVLRHWGYNNVIAVASGRHHEYLKSLGAAQTFDYTKPGVERQILEHVSSSTTGSTSSATIPYIIDCIGSVEGTLRPLTKIAQRGTRVAVMMPVIVRDATVEEEPEYAMDPTEVLVGEWAEGVILRGVRTHFYLENEFFKEKLQPEIVPALVEKGIVQPNRYRIVEGATTVERAEKALDLLRRRAVSGERLVWAISD